MACHAKARTKYDTWRGCGSLVIAGLVIVQEHRRPSSPTSKHGYVPYPYLGQLRGADDVGACQLPQQRQGGALTLQ